MSTEKLAKVVDWTAAAGIVVISRGFSEGMASSSDGGPRGLNE